MQYPLNKIEDTVKPDYLSIWCIIIIHPVLRVVWLFANYTKLTPNQITVASFTFGLASAFCFLQGNWTYLIIGACLFETSYILDCVDGKIARLKGSKSAVGAYLDIVGDVISKFIVAFCLILGQYLLTNDVSYFLWGVPYIFLQTVSYLSGATLHRLEDEFYKQNLYKNPNNYAVANNFIRSKFPFASKIVRHLHARGLSLNPLTQTEAQTVALFICPMLIQVKIGLLLGSIITFGEALVFALFYFLIKWRRKI